MELGVEEEEEEEQFAPPAFEYTPPATVGEDESFGTFELPDEEEADEIPVEKEHIIRWSHGRR